METKNIFFESITKIFILLLIIIILLLNNYLPIYTNGDKKTVLLFLFSFIVSLIINILYNEIKWIFHYLIVKKMDYENQIKVNFLQHNFEINFSTFIKLFKIIFKEKFSKSFIVIFKILSLICLFVSIILISLTTSDTGTKIGEYEFCSWTSNSLKNFYASSAINQIKNIGITELSSILWEQVPTSYLSTLYKTTDARINFYQFNSTQASEFTKKGTFLSPYKITYIDQPPGTMFGLITTCNSKIINTTICNLPVANTSIVDNNKILENYNLGKRGIDTMINNTFILNLNISYDINGYPILNNLTNIYKTNNCQNIEMKCLIGGGNYIKKMRNRLGVIDKNIGIRENVDYIEEMSDTFSAFMSIMFNYQPINISEFTYSSIIVNKKLLGSIFNDSYSYSKSMEPFLQIVGVLSNFLTLLDSDIEECNKSNESIISTNDRPSGILTVITIILLIIPILSIIFEYIWLYNLNNHIMYLWIKTNNIIGWLSMIKPIDSSIRIDYNENEKYIKIKKNIEI